MKTILRFTAVFLILVLLPIHIAYGATESYIRLSSNDAKNVQGLGLWTAGQCGMSKPNQLVTIGATGTVSADYEFNVSATIMIFGF